MATVFSKKHIRHLPRHVERSEASADQTEHKWNFRRFPRQRRVQNFVLAPKAREENRKPSQRHHADRIRFECERHLLTQPAHMPNVLLVMTSMNDCTRAKEQQRLKKCVRN